MCIGYFAKNYKYCKIIIIKVNYLVLFKQCSKKIYTLKFYI